MSSNSSKPEYYKNEITEEDLKKLEEIMDKMINDNNINLNESFQIN